MAFHVARSAREKYQFDDTQFNVAGTALIQDFYSARVFAHKLNAHRPPGTRQAAASEINAMNTLAEVSRALLAEYRQQINTQAFSGALTHVTSALGRPAVDAALARFTQLYPPMAVFRLARTADAHLADDSDGRPNREIAIEELLMLWLFNMNPACAQYGELFSHAALKENTAYQPLIDALTTYFAAQPPLLENQTLVAALRAPALAHPESLEAQLEFIETHWLAAVPALKTYVLRVLTSKDFISEEARAQARYFGQGFQGMGTPVFDVGDIRGAIRGGGGGGGGGGGPSGAVVANYATDPEYEAYTQDRAWMPRLVLLAKNAYVWLDQLSKKYQRDIARLDQVPDEELDQLRDWGITGLWLIGLWERSRASKRIKQMMGAEDAVASAYSLMDYRIADDLGGEAAMAVLKERAWRRGVRMGSDMVPNHFGIDSTWVMNHPDFFLSLDQPPYPSYTFNGPDLSDDARVGIYLEDHYYTRSDAAVVFKRLDRWTGGERYIYHGNDGTTMPWNDTAQLNYLRADVREAIIQTILHVARQFPIIRFDAAMTLAKRHVQRLWFPIPGTADGIPSRAGLGLTKEDFDRMHPQEFWREVVDRAAVEAPDTLLLAEAFWMLEGYFVRTLGMHRVYNSAYMHMLRDEDNAKYRYLIKETLEFDPQILKRYVNFMNNPDEKTAVEQFGKGDKYFGVALVMSTLPGLPMFGHGQVEGYGEKYGMEYRRPKLNETPDFGLIEHHKRMIFPVLHKRYLFAEVERFYLYDFQSTDGALDENVFAYSNQFGDERALVLCHNRLGAARGFVRTSVEYLVKGEGLRRISLADALALHNDPAYFLLYRDHVSGLEFIRSARELHERGLFVELSGYQSALLWDMREVQDTTGAYARLNAELAGRGVPNISEEMRETEFAAVLWPARELINATSLRLLNGSRVLREHVKRGKAPLVDATVLEQTQARLLELLQEARQQAQGEAALSAADLTADDCGAADCGAADCGAVAERVLHDVSGVLRARVLAKRAGEDKTSEPDMADAPAAWAPLLVWSLLHRVGEVVCPADSPAARNTSARWLDEWSLRKPVLDAFRGLGMDEGTAQHALSTVRALIAQSGSFALAHDAAIDPARAVAAAWFADNAVRSHLGVNAWQGVEYFNKETFEALTGQLLAAHMALMADDRSTVAKKATAAEFQRATAIVATLATRAAAGGYQVTRLVVAQPAADSEAVPPTKRTRVSKKPVASAVKAKPRAKPAKATKPAK